MRLSVTSWPPLAVQCSCSNVFVSRLGDMSRVEFTLPVRTQIVQMALKEKARAEGPVGLPVVLAPRVDGAPVVVAPPPVVLEAVTGALAPVRAP